MWVARLAANDEAFFDAPTSNSCLLGSTVGVVEDDAIVSTSISSRSYAGFSR